MEINGLLCCLIHIVLQKILFYVQQKKKVVQFWNDMRASK